jgi:hypothetical protein
MREIYVELPRLYMKSGSLALSVVVDLENQGKQSVAERKTQDRSKPRVLDQVQVPYQKADRYFQMPGSYIVPLNKP